MSKYTLPEAEVKEAYIKGIISLEEYHSYNKWIVGKNDYSRPSSLTFDQGDNFYLTMSALKKLQQAGLVYNEKPYDTSSESVEQIEAQAEIILDRIHADIINFEKDPLSIKSAGDKKVTQKDIDEFVNNLKKQLQNFDAVYRVTRGYGPNGSKYKELEEKYKKINQRLDDIKANFLGYNDKLSEARNKRFRYEDLKAEYNQMSPLKRIVARKKKQEMEQMRKESIIGTFDDYIAAAQKEQGGRGL